MFVRADSPSTPVDLARLVGEPTPARMIGEPDPLARLSPGALAFRQDSPVATVLGAVATAPEFETFDPTIVDSLGSTDSTQVVCADQPRPTLEASRLDVGILRMIVDTGVVDLRISELETADAVSGILERAHEAYTICESHSTDDGWVSREVIPFVSLSGQNGLNLVSRLTTDVGGAATSQTLAVGTDRYLVEVRVTVVGDLRDFDEVDPVQLLDAAERAL